MSLRLPLCDFCKHYTGGKETPGMCCEAFPDGIPIEKIKFDDDGKECAKGIGFEEEE